MSSISITWDKKSTKLVNDNIKKYFKTIQNAAGPRLKLAAVEIMAESSLQVPVDTDTLRNTSNIYEPEILTDGSVQVTMDYAGANDQMNMDKQEMASTYAVEVHETPEGTYDNGGPRHKYPTKWKFLEDPVVAYANTLLPMLALGLRR